MKKVFATALFGMAALALPASAATTHELVSERFDQFREQVETCFAENEFSFCRAQLPEWRAILRADLRAILDAAVQERVERVGR